MTAHCDRVYKKRRNTLKYMYFLIMRMAAWRYISNLSLHEATSPELTKHLNKQTWQGRPGSAAPALGAGAAARARLMMLVLPKRLQKPQAATRGRAGPAPAARARLVPAVAARAAPLRRRPRGRSRRLGLAPSSPTAAACPPTPSPTTPTAGTSRSIAAAPPCTDARAAQTALDAGRWWCACTCVRARTV